MAKITKRVVDAAASDPTRQVLIWDDHISGFGLVIYPSGAKSYVFQYRSPEGRSHRATIGKHGDWTPTQARERADELRTLVKAGRDPLTEKRTLKQAPTVTDLLDAYLASDWFKEKARSTQSIDRGRIERHLRPLLGRRHAHAVTDSDVKKILAAIRDGKTATKVKTGKRGLARVTGGQGAARMSVDLLKAIFAWAVRERMVATNPCQHVRTGTSGVRESIIEDAAQYAALFQALDRLELQLRVRSAVADAIRLIAFTGCRRSEAANLRWRHVELDRGRIVLPPQSHKTGKRTGKPRIIALPALAQAIISKQPAGKNDAFVFAPAKGDGAIALSKVWRIVRTEAGLPDGIGLHGLRHSIASQLAMAGAGAPEIMTALGHRQLSTVQRYIHFAENARSALAERAASVAVAGMAAVSNPHVKAVGLKGRAS